MTAEKDSRTDLEEKLAPGWDAASNMVPGVKLNSCAYGNKTSPYVDMVRLIKY